MKKFLILSAIFPALFSTLQAQETEVYHLFHPVPKEKLREMETDRPNITESPITTDAGHLQVETDLFRLEKTNGEGLLKTTRLFNQANLKLGISGSTAIQLVVQSYVSQKEFTDGSSERSNGFGDLTLRIKQNLLGNDKGDFAVALLPYLKFPTASALQDDRYEGGVIVPMSLKLGGEWKLGMQVEFDRLQNEDGEGHYTQLLESLTASHPLFKKLDAVAETYYTYDIQAHQWNNFLNAALQLEVAKDIKIDGGLNYGIQHEAMRSYFLGLSFRL
ncbi:transporter [Pedobacter sp. PF22-3]|uniref:transporter n=1 Tax=Pedobacter sp. PF22-3 TaxID=2994467 RepID=UPI0022460B68|nr:transporter [Pedobacter sp. PF22-3]MCX2495288.1 transporter [Pedobacter sp. PF22-3]